MRGMALLLIVTATLAGCQSATENPPPPERPARAAAEPAKDAPRRDDRARPVAYVDGRALTDADLRAGLYEAAGGDVLADAVLDRAVAWRLEERGLSVDAQAIEAERALLGRSLSPDADTAVRLLDELRRSRRLGPTRFEALLRRSAGLRRLVADRVEVTDSAIRREHERRYGPRYRVRLLVTDDADEAAELRRRALDGESFADLASLHSIDPSAAQGGLLSPISPADTQYPQAVRRALPRLDAAPISGVLALGDRFAVLKLADKIEAADVALDDVTDELVEAVRRRQQRLLMERLARQMLAEAEVVVLDPALQAAWRAQQAELTEPR